MRKLLTIIMTLFVVYASGQGINERYVKARERLETNLHFIYQGNYIPAKDITYHEFSADSITWRKNYVAGDCYVRFANTTANITNPYYSTTGYHNNWWVLNFCTLNGALDSIGNSVDSIFVHYYQSDTIYVTDTVIVDDGIIDIKIPAPDTITGSTGNTQDTAYHTHQVYLFLNDLENVDATPTDGQVLKYNSITGKWQAANDLVGGGGSSLKVKEIDDSPSINNVLTIAVSEGHLTNLGSGEVFLDLTLDPHLGVNDYWRSDTVRVDAGDTDIEFSSPLPDDDYIIASLYAILDNGGRQDLQYDSITDSGFKALDVIDSAWVHYIAIRNVDSLLAFVSDVGKVLASPTDTVLTYLSSKTDDSTIVVVNNDLHVLRALDADSLGGLYAGEYITWADTGYVITLPQLIDSLDSYDLGHSPVTLGDSAAAKGFSLNGQELEFDYSDYMFKSVYDTDSDGLVNDSEKLSGSSKSTTAYAASWNGSDSIPTQNSIYDKLELIMGSIIPTVYTVTLPVAANLTASIAAATEGVDYPTGWILTASGTTLRIQHDLGRYVSKVSVFYNTSGATYRQLVDFQTAYNTIENVSTNIVDIISLSSSYTSYKLRISLIIE